MDSENLTITLSTQDWQIVMAGLGELQAKFAIPVMQRLQAAVTAAQQPQPEPLKEAAE